MIVPASNPREKKENFCLCLILLMQIRGQFVFTSQLLHGISCKLPIKNGWRSTNSLARMAYSSIYTLLRTQTDSIWSYLPSMRRMTQESAARHSMNTCVNWKSTVIWFGNTQTYLIFTLRPALRTSVRIPISTKKESISRKIRLANPLLAMNPQHKFLVRQMK